MAKFLVTGGLGFLGTSFLEKIPRLQMYESTQFVCLDKNDYFVDILNWQSAVPLNVKLILGDITDTRLITKILNEFDISIVVHFAAETHVDKSFGQSLAFTKSNIYGTHVLLECCREYGKITRFFHMSTDEVYGDVPPSLESCLPHRDHLDPTNPYAATKAGAEYLVRSYLHSFKLPTVIIRCTNLYGPGQYPDKIVPKFYKCLKEGKPLTVHGCGKAVRRYIHINDVTDAFVVILQKSEIGQIIQIGSKDDISVLEVAEYMIHLFQPNEEIRKHMSYVEDRAYNDMRYALDTSLLENMGWKQKITDFKEGLRDTVKWYDENGFKRWLFVELNGMTRVC